MSKKLFKDSDIFYNLSTESIAPQHNDYSVPLIVTEFQKIIDVMEKNNYITSTQAIKDKDIYTSITNIDNIISKRFGIKYKHVSSNNGAYSCFTVPPSNYSSVSKFNSEFFKYLKSTTKGMSSDKTKTSDQIRTLEKDSQDLTFRWVESMNSMEKTLNTKSVGVDLQKAVINNLPNEYVVFLLINIPFLVKTIKLTAKQITAVLYHEIGHSFTHIEYSYKTVNNTTALIDSIREGIEKKNKSLKDSLIIAYERTYKEDVSKLKEKNTILVLLKTVEKHIETHVGFNPTKGGTVDSEQLADQFATRFGLGEDIIISLKLIEEHVKEEYTGYVAYGKMLLEGFLIFTMFGIILTSTLLGGLTITVIAFLVMLILNIISSYLTSGNLEVDKVYDSYKRRLIRVRNDIVRQIRTSDVPKDVMKTVLDNIENINIILKDIPDDQPGMIDRLMINLTSGGRRASEYKNIESITEDLMENNLHIAAAKFKNI